LLKTSFHSLSPWRMYTMRTLDTCGGGQARRCAQNAWATVGALHSTHRHSVGDDDLRVDGALLLPLLVAAEEHVLQAWLGATRCGVRARGMGVAALLRRAGGSGPRGRTQRKERRLAQRVGGGARAHQRASCGARHSQRWERQRAQRHAGTLYLHARDAAAWRNSPGTCQAPRRGRKRAASRWAAREPKGIKARMRTHGGRQQQRHPCAAVARA
jgi:hypothetical protein